MAERGPDFLRQARGPRDPARSGPHPPVQTSPTAPPSQDRTRRPWIGDPGGTADGKDVRRFWTAYAVSELGSGIGAGALPLVAILVIQASDWQVSLLAVLGGIAGVAVAVPLGPWIEFHHKRPVMVSADLIRFFALASVPAAAVFGVLSYGQLCVVAVVQTAGTIVSSAASTPYLKALAPAADRARVNGRLETTSWTAGALGPPVGGLLVSATSPVTSILIDAVSYLIAAYGWRRIRRPQPAPAPSPSVERRWLADTLGRWRYILAHRILAKLYTNSMIFGGCVMASSPLIAVYLLRDLHFNALSSAESVSGRFRVLFGPDGQTLAAGC